MPQQPKYTPAEETLLDSLRHSAISDTQRQNMWDAYHFTGDEKGFVENVNKYTDFTDEVKQSLYNLRFKGTYETKQPQGPTTGGAPVAIGAPGVQEAPYLKEFRALTGRGLPPKEAAAYIGAVGEVEETARMGNEPLSTGQKIEQQVRRHFIEPFEKAGEFGTKISANAAELLITKDPTFSRLARSRMGGLPSEKVSPIIVGVARGGAGMVGGMVADPRNWPFFASSAARPILQKLISGGFGTMMAHGAVERAQFLYDNWDNLTPQDRAEHTTQLVGESGMATLATAHALTGKKAVLPRPPSRAETLMGTGAEAPKTVPEQVRQSHLSEIDRLKEVARHPAASPEEKAIAENQIQNHREMLGQAPPAMGPTPTPEVPVEVAATPRPSVPVIPEPAPKAMDVPAVITEAGLVNKGEVVKGSNIWQIEHPDHPGLTSAVSGPQLESSKAMRDAMSAKLDAFAAKPSQVAGQPEQIPGQLQANAAKLRSEAIPAPLPRPISPAYKFTGELPLELQENINQLIDLRGQIEVAETPAQKSAISRYRDRIVAQAQTRVRNLLPILSPEQLTSLQESLGKTGQQNVAQGKAIQDLVSEHKKNIGLKAQVREILSTGGPVREMVVGEAGERAVVKPEAEVARGGRDLLHQLMGEKPFTTPEQLTPHPRPKGVSEEAYASLLTKLEGQRSALRMEIARDFEIAKDTGTTLDESNIPDKLDELAQIEKLMGKYPSAEGVSGRRRIIQPEVGPSGEVAPGAPLRTITKKHADLVFGRNMRTIPSPEEFLAEAGKRAEKGRIHNMLADAIGKFLEKTGKGKEGGFVGDVPVDREQFRTSVKEEDVAPAKLGKEATKVGIKAWPITIDRPSGPVGWLSPDGKVFLDNGLLDHDSVAITLLPNHRNPMYGMLEHGWVRKVNNRAFEAWHLNEKVINTIERDMLHNHVWSRDVLIDTRTPLGIRPLSIEGPWENLIEAVQQAKRGRINQAGRIGGAEMLTGGAVGALTGAKIGASIAGPTGAIVGGGIGWVTGMLAPAAMRSPAVRTAFRRVGPMLRGSGISMRDWLRGPEQRPPVSNDMANILEAQNADASGPTLNLIQRIAQLPGDINRALFDRFVFVNDRPGALPNFLMKFDPRGEAFRALRGKLSVDESPYVSAWLAAGGGGGFQEVHLLGYRNILRDATKGGLLNNFQEYLNLKGYQRVYDVLNERVQERVSEVANFEAQLKQNPNMNQRLKLRYLERIQEARSEIKDIHKRMESKKLTPEGYDPSKIASELSQLQQTLGPQYGEIQGLANRVFDMNRQVLDMLHQSGIISAQDYQTYVGRGNEYVPMHRILESISGNEFRLAGKSPLYLRQQNVIHALSGSEKINREPLVASADANLEAIKEVMRNGVIKDFLGLAAKDPEGVGTLFERVPSDYKAKPNESLVGAYEDGQSITYRTPTWLGETLKGVSPISTDVVGGVVMRWSRSILQKGATGANLAWSVPNAIRDLSEMAALSEGGIRKINVPKDIALMLRDWNKSLYEAMLNKPAWQEYMRSGAAYSTLQRNISPEHFLSMEELGFRGKLARGRVLDFVQDFNAAVEDATKLTTFKRLREAGYSIKAAAWETRRYGGSPDFARSGTMTPAINLVWMFFNANLQGITRVFARARENPKRVAIALGALAALGMTLNSHNQNLTDEKGEPLMRKVSITDRENNWVILTGDTYTSSTGATLPFYYKVPKPHFIKMLYNPMENIFNKVGGREMRSGKQIALDAISNPLPGQFNLKEGEVGRTAVKGLVSSLNPALRIPIEQVGNFTGERSIIPEREARLEPWAQYGPTTSATAREMGTGGMAGAKAGAAIGGGLGYAFEGLPGLAIGAAVGAGTGILGVSPRRIEHIIKGGTGGVGTAAIGVSDPFFGGVKQSRSMEGSEKIRQIPAVGAIAGRFVGLPSDQEARMLEDRFYSYMQEGQAPYLTFKMLARSDITKAQEYFQQNKQGIVEGRIGEKLQGKLSEISAAQRQIEQNPNISDAARKKTLVSLHNTKVQLLRSFNRVISQFSQNPE